MIFFKMLLLLSAITTLVTSKPAPDGCSVEGKKYDNGANITHGTFWSICKNNTVVGKGCARDDKLYEIGETWRHKNFKELCNETKMDDTTTIRREITHCYDKSNNTHVPGDTWVFRDGNSTFGFRKGCIRTDKGVELKTNGCLHYGNNTISHNGTVVDPGCSKKVSNSTVFRCYNSDKGVVKADTMKIEKFGGQFC